MPTAQHAVTTELSDAEISERLRGMLIEAPEMPEPSWDPIPGSDARYWRPWVDAADEYIRWAQHPEERVHTGINDFDRAMRGLAPGELLQVIGYAHSGKTVFTQQVLLHNHDKRVAWFTPDETRVAVLVKMSSILHGISAEELEERLAVGEPDAEVLLRDVARQHFKHFAVFDEINDLSVMDEALKECVDVWGGLQPQLVVIDYLDLVMGDGEDVRSKMSAVKRWGKQHRIPLMLIHQASRSSGADGKKMGISSGGYGGEADATFIIGVRRKREQYKAEAEEFRARLRMASQDATIQRLTDQIADAEYEERRHANTVTFSLVKNKRPPSRLVDDIDFLLEASTGRLMPFDGAAASKATYEQRVQWEEERMWDEPF